jgi:hypothetical protein
MLIISKRRVYKMPNDYSFFEYIIFDMPRAIVILCLFLKLENKLILFKCPKMTLNRIIIPSFFISIIYPYSKYFFMDFELSIFFKNITILLIIFFLFYELSDNKNTFFSNLIITFSIDILVFQILIFVVANFLIKIINPDFDCLNTSISSKFMLLIFFFIAPYILLIKIVNTENVVCNYFKVTTNKIINFFKIILKIERRD